jgi:LPS-assembly protein
MKNKIIKIFILGLFFLISFLKNSYSEEFQFLGSELKFLDNGNLIVGTNGIKITSENQIIEANKFEYNKVNLHLKLLGQIKIIDNLKNTIITGDKIEYFENLEKFFAEGDVEVKVDDKYIIYSTDLTYLRIKEHFFSKNKSTFIDNIGNKFELNKLDYFKLLNKIRGSKIKFTDAQLNKFYIEDAIIDLQKNEIVGKDVAIDFVNSAFVNNKNEPRLKGNKIYSDQNITTISKGIFTTCKKTDNCPPWTMQASEVKHDKIKQTINYKNAWLKIYDKPVLYFPRFFHPDPTVKRQSGFLMPSLTSANTLGSSIEIPYFKALAGNKDLTFKPRLYADKSVILQSEYRLEKEKSSHIFDFGFFSDGNQNIFDNKNRKNHFFSNSKFNFDSKIFDETKIEVNIETTSNDTFLKTYKIKSPLIESETLLNSYTNVEMNNEDTYIKASLESYTDLTADKKKRYEYIYPNVIFTKDIKLDASYKGSLTFDSNTYHKKYDVNSHDSVNINNFKYTSFDYVLNNGLKNNFNLLIKNVNTDGHNSVKNRNDLSNKILGSIIFESSYPLKKTGINYNSFLEPVASLRYSPNETKNAVKKDRRIDINNIFSTNRISMNDGVEGGESITIGNTYRLTNNKTAKEYLSLGIASNFRLDENVDLPIKSTIGKKSSDIVGNAKISPNKYFQIDYNFSLDNNLDSNNYDSIKTTFSLNNFVTSFEFLQEEGDIGNKSFIQNNTSYNFDEENSLSFSTRKNKVTDLTEFYNLIYQYKNDCLSAGVEYNKEYYTDNDLKPTEQLLFTITIIPFGKINTANLRQ